MSDRKIVFNTLQRLEICYTLLEHEAVYTMEDMRRLGLNRQGTLAKNLFLRDAKGKRHFLVILKEEKVADLKQLEFKLGSTKLSFASEERLTNYLGLEKGAVSPFGVLNSDPEAIEVVFDRDLISCKSLGFHPNDNTATLFLSFADLETVIKEHGNSILYISL